MRGFSACKIFLCIVTLSGAVLLSLTASATTLERTVALDARYGVTIIRFIVAGNSPTGTVDIKVVNPTTQNYSQDRVYLGNGSDVFTQILQPGTWLVTLDYSGDTANPPASLTFTVTQPTLDWVPTVVERLLSD